MFELLRGFTTLHSKVKEFTLLKEGDDLPDDFIREYKEEAEVIKILTRLDFKLRPKSSQIKKLPEFESWVKVLQNKIK